MVWDVLPCIAQEIEVREEGILDDLLLFELLTGWCKSTGGSVVAI
jgi:hypothetical protein